MFSNCFSFSPETGLVLGIAITYNERKTPVVILGSTKHRGRLVYASVAPKVISDSHTVISASLALLPRSEGGVHPHLTLPEDTLHAFYVFIDTSVPGSVHTGEGHGAVVAVRSTPMEIASGIILTADGSVVASQLLYKVTAGDKLIITSAADLSYLLCAEGNGVTLKEVGPRFLKEFLAEGELDLLRGQMEEASVVVKTDAYRRLLTLFRDGLRNPLLIDLLILHRKDVFQSAQRIFDELVRPELLNLARGAGWTVNGSSDSAQIMLVKGAVSRTFHVSKPAQPVHRKRSKAA